MMLMEDYKKEINNSLKEIQENTSNQVKELNKTIRDLNMEVETIKKSQSKTILKMQNLEKKSGAIDERITNRIQRIEERISRAEDTIENIDTTKKMQKELNTKHPGNPGHNEKNKPKNDKYRREQKLPTSMASKL
jgi:predicted  nucleic acid-binding Zn-ribbon protein